MHVINFSEHYISYNEITRAADSLPNLADQFTLYGLYCGVRGNWYSELACSSIEGCNRETRTLWLAEFKKDGSINRRGRRFKADQRLFEYATKAANTFEYEKVWREGIVKRYPLADESFLIIKGIKAQSESVLSPGTIRVKTANRLNKIIRIVGWGEQYKAADIFWSGFLYHVSLQKIKRMNDGCLNSPEDVFEVPGVEAIYSQYGTNKTNARYNLERYF